jgi:hypothetical protein
LADELDAANVWNFSWGRWIVNASTETRSVEMANFESFRRATPGESAEFRPLEADPLIGAWTAAAIPAATIELPPFSQAILINPQACPNCLGVAGDYNGDGLVNQADYQSWRAAFGTANADADGNEDDIVDTADYVVWRRAATAADQLMKTTLTSAMTVPEPHAFWLAISSAALVSLPRR